MSQYLNLLPIRPAHSEPEGRSSAGPPVRLRTVVAAIALVAISSVMAMALGRISAIPRADVPPGWPAGGCLSASVALWRGTPSTRVPDGQASVCIAESGLRATLDLEHLEPAARYVEWMAYFESPGLCSLSQLLYQVNHFERPCTLVDLETSPPLGTVHSVSEAAADVRSVLHIDAPIREINLAPRAQAWLLVSRPVWSPVPHSAYRTAHDDPREPVARAVFDVP